MSQTITNGLKISVKACSKEDKGIGFIPNVFLAAPKTKMLG